jgi:hypothetical protein
MDRDDLLIADIVRIRRDRGLSLSDAVKKAKKDQRLRDKLISAPVRD